MTHEWQKSSDRTMSKINVDRLLPPLSCLNDKKSLKRTSFFELIAGEVAATGYFDVEWGDSGLLVSPVGHLSSTGRMTMNNDAPFLRPKTQSSVQFTKKGNHSRPHSSEISSAAAPLSLSAELPQLHRSASSSRSSRLAQSTESISRMDTSHIPLSNLKALHQGCIGDTADTAVPGPIHKITVPEMPELHASNDLPGQGHETILPRRSGCNQSFKSSGSSQPHRLSTPIIQNMSLKSIGSMSESLRTPRIRPMAGFRPSRAQAFLVYNEMDKSKKGKITCSELEEACICLGYSLEQATSLFHRLDAGQKGFLTTVDWGNKDAFRIIEQFTLMYMRRFMGLPEASATDDEVRRYKRIQEVRTVKSLPAAINLVRINAVARGSRSTTSSGNPIYDAFRFIDSDNSGMLSRDELKDGFSALGVSVTERVTDQIMEYFDRDKNGTVEYHEFCKVLFPNKG